MERIDTPSERRLRDNRGRFMKRSDAASDTTPPNHHHHHHHSHDVAHILTPVLVSPALPQPPRLGWLGPIWYVWRCAVLLLAFVVGYVTSYVRHTTPSPRIRPGPIRVTSVPSCRPFPFHNGTRKTNTASSFIR